MLVYGVVLGWARVRTGGLAASIGLHMTINAVAAGTLLLNQ
jgi:membrane protease YdiL (CAAX protease family)